MWCVLKGSFTQTFIQTDCFPILEILQVLIEASLPPSPLLSPDTRSHEWLDRRRGAGWGTDSVLVWGPEEGTSVWQTSFVCMFADLHEGYQIRALKHKQLSQLLLQSCSVQSGSGSQGQVGPLRAKTQWACPTAAPSSSNGEEQSLKQCCNHPKSIYNKLFHMMRAVFVL